MKKEINDVLLKALGAEFNLEFLSILNGVERYKITCRESTKVVVLGFFKIENSICIKMGNIKYFELTEANLLRALFLTVYFT
ncbi:hypothetical protein [Emticicia sp. BO119]|uniref:hypothetical protein n=1 Tax=Emticicia sp. BO119 TaxID=2757768 RepID=UPI0015EFEAE3|nr:hypothetical protein [Emticicia sp. BO119]MBA4852068.1 hypothetical protein [Emticicia sp. BO119]